MKSLSSTAMVKFGALLVALLVLLYWSVRSSENERLREQNKQLSQQVSSAQLLLPQLDTLRRHKPSVPQKVSVWLNTQVLKGFENRLISNDPFNQGRGSKVKIRKMTPQELTSLLNRLDQFNLVIENLTIDDFDQDGYWEIDLSIKEPVR